MIVLRLFGIFWRYGVAALIAIAAFLYLTREHATFMRQLLEWEQQIPDLLEAGGVTDNYLVLFEIVVGNGQVILLVLTVVARMLMAIMGWIAFGHRTGT